MRPGNPKITKTNPKKVHQPLLPLRRGEKTTTKIQSVMQPTRRTTPHQWFKHHPTSTHQKRRISHTNQPNKKQLAHYRVLTQHTHTQTHPTTGPAQSDLTDPTHTHTTNKIAVNADQMKGSTSARFPTAISPEPLPGGALSVTLTHIKLHTPNQQHKSPGQPAFLRLILRMVRVNQSHEIPGLNCNADRREDSRCH